MFAAVKRATLLYPSGTNADPNKKHLFILLTDPCGPADQVLMVNVSTVYEGGSHDGTCYLNPGDHPFIQRKSYIAYGQCRIERAGDLVAGVANGRFVDRGLLDVAVFERVCAGMHTSKYVKPFARDFFDEAS